MDTKKQAICEALRAWINQRPGLEFGNYGNLASYRAEVRSIGTDLKHARELLRAVELRDAITGDDLAAAFPHAYSGRLSLKVESGMMQNAGYYGLSTEAGTFYKASLDYCTGQYWPTEYRKAACAVLASALWSWQRDNMPAPRGKLSRTHGPFTTEHDDIEGMTPGDWLRASFRRQFGRGIANRWFN